MAPCHSERSEESRHTKHRALCHPDAVLSLPKERSEGSGAGRSVILRRLRRRISLRAPPSFSSPSPLHSLAADARGTLLMETVLAVAVLTLVGTIMLNGLSTSFRSGGKTAGQSTAENLARNQMEYAFSLPYVAAPSSYPSIIAPTGYSVTAAASIYQAGNPNVEKLTVTVNRGGTQLLVLDTIRVQ